MKKTVITLLASIALLPINLMAQQNVPSKNMNAQYLQLADENAKKETTAHLSLISKKYKLDEKTYKTIYQAFYNRRIETEKALLQTDKSVASQNNLVSLINKHDSICNSYLKALSHKNLIGNKILESTDNSKFASAIRSKSLLKLSQVQIDSLLYHSKKMAELKIEDAGLDLRGYERKVLPLLLQDEQYTSLLIELNRPTALGWAQDSWQSIKKRGLEGGLDSVVVIRQMFNYNLGKLVKKDRFGKDLPTTSPSLSRFDSAKPEALRMLQADEARNVADKPKETKTSFAW
ncbi:hypothetical protein FYC62_12955 [Pedobacter aquae]|uniref:DUF4142 domain-containing protein n=1 Tax=Pedobacter aquae TaxID=2605747 RepID=A0A5C0VLC0_9SPHI|nr:hypothetical protein [Pedobacter aquae]QEK52461.1 hypothetical protein FYC62_12955 [Pedobacter aquae]